MNKIDEVKNEEVNAEVNAENKRPSKTTKYIRNESVKLILIYIFVTIVTSRISFLKSHEIARSTVNSGIFVFMSIRFVSRTFTSYYSEFLELNQVDIYTFEESREKYRLLHKAGHVERFSVIKCLFKDIKKLFPLCLLWAYILISDSDYSISNIFFITMLMMPFLSIWSGYKKWINDGALKLMGINRDDMEDVED